MPWESPQATRRSNELPLWTCVGAVAGEVGGHGISTASLSNFTLTGYDSKL